MNRDELQAKSKKMDVDNEDALQDLKKHEDDLNNLR